MSKVLALPPTAGISDPSVRAFCDAIASAWSVRNGGGGPDAERFVRVGEIGGLASEAVVQVLSGAASPAAVSMTGNPLIDYSRVVRAVADLVTSSKLYELLRTPIQPIAAPTQKLQELLGRVSTETSSRIAAIQQEADARIAAINAEAGTRQGQVNDLQTQINTIVAAGTSDTATILAALQDEQTARVNGDNAEASERQTLAAQMRGTYTGTDVSLITEGLIYSERQARVSADGSLTTSLNALSARVDNNQAAIVTEQTTRASADTANANSITALTSRVSTAEGNITSELSTRANKDNSLAQAINTIWASIGGAMALIQDGQLASVSPAAVSATKWSQVQAAVTDPNTGAVNAVSIKQELNTYASKVDGTMDATWAIRANNNGVISAVALMTSAGAGSAAGAPTSNFMIMANRLSLVSPANESLTPVPFSVDDIGNAVFTGTVYAAAGVFGGALSAASGSFMGQLLAATGTFSGSLTANAVNAVDTINLRGQSVTIPLAACSPLSLSVGTNGANTVMQTLTIQSTGAPIIVLTGLSYGCSLYVTPSSGSSPSQGSMAGTVRLKRNGVELIGSQLFSVGGSGGQYYGTSGVLALPPFSDTPGPGTWTYTLELSYSLSGAWGSNWCNAANRCIVLIEAKR